MSVITISRGLCSRGKEVAEEAAARLGFECVSRDVILKAAEEFDIPEIRLDKALHDSPSVFERFTHEKDRYISYIRKVFFQHIQKGNVVYHGLAGHYFLSDIPNVLKIRITSDLNDRVKEESRRMGIPEDQARHLLEKEDDERRKWGISLYGIDTWDSRLYDMVLHIGALTVSDAVDIICATAQKPYFQLTPACQKALNDSLLAATVHSLLISRSPNIRVNADDGVIRIQKGEKSVQTDSAAADEIRSIARKVDGVKEVVFSQLPHSSGHHAVNPFHNI